MRSPNPASRPAPPRRPHDVRRVRITEVGPRDGLQNERAITISAATKIAFVDALSRSGVAEIEVSSFVSPKWVPQLADAAEVFAGIERNPEIAYSALVPNLRGLEAAVTAGADKISIFTAASESFNRRNINASIEESVARLAPVVAEAEKAGRPVRGYVSCVVACPYEGPIAPAGVATVVQRLLDLGVDEIDLGETIGAAAPTDILRLYDALAAVVQPASTTLHMHDTRGTGLACVLAAMREFGVSSFDASAGGLGGCPYAPGAAGNLATEDLVYCLERMDIDTGVDLDALLAADAVIARAFGSDRPLPGRTLRAGGRPRGAAE